MLTAIDSVQGEIIKTPINATKLKIAVMPQLMARQREHHKFFMSSLDTKS